MSREIKFRAWHEAEQVMGWPELERAAEGYVDAAGGALMQLTGLTDDSGNDIYEGDILRLAGGYDQGECEHDQMVRFHPDGQWMATCVRGCGECALSELDEAVIVGNIHENPELFL